MFRVEEIQSLNELELIVYQYVMEHKSTVPYMRIRELATECHVSTTTVLKFCTKMGCGGYAEFKLLMKEYVGYNQVVPLFENKEELERFFEERFPSPKFQEQLNQAAAILAKVENILFVGIGNSGHIAQYAARYFTNVGKFSLYVSDPFYPIKSVQSIASTIVILSVSGESEQVIKFAQDIKRANCPLISITSTRNCTLAKLADVPLSYGVSILRGSNLVDYTTQVPVVYILEVLGKQVQNRLLEK